MYDARSRDALTRGDWAAAMSEARRGLELTGTDPVLRAALHHRLGTALAQTGDTAGARAVNARLLESFAFETGDDAPNPVPTKAMLRTLGLPGGACRLPMGPEPDWLEGRARAVHAALVAARG